MSTKVPEPCPECGSSTMPIDRVVAIDMDYRPLAVKLWRYACDDCGWIWANLLQRAHNDREVVKAKRRAAARHVEG